MSHGTLGFCRKSVKIQMPTKTVIGRDGGEVRFGSRCYATLSFRSILFSLEQRRRLRFGLRKPPSVPTARASNAHACVMARASDTSIKAREGVMKRRTLMGIGLVAAIAAAVATPASAAPA